MKVAFLLGSPDISGGTYVIFEHATRLNRLGYQVTIVTEVAVAEKSYGWHPTAGELVWNTFAGLEHERFDLAIATWWQSVYQLTRIHSRKYLYFIQSIESRFFTARIPDDPALRDIDILSEWCENTYRFCLPVITEARWIQNYLHERHNRPSMLVRNGIRKDIYAESGSVVAPRQHGCLRVLVEGPLGVFFKNVEKTITLCRQAGVDEVWLLTSSEISGYPGVDRYFSRVPIEHTAEIYRSCDVLVKLSYVEGMFGPPLEMFHCGGTAIVYDVTGHDEYIIHGENSLVVERDNEQEVVAWLKRLKSDAELLGKLKEGARKTAQSWPDWGVATNEFRQAIEQYGRMLPDMSDSFLSEYSNFMFSVRDNALKSRELTRLAERERSGGDRSISFLNHIQVYWDAGQGMEAVLTDSYASGSWCRCSVVVPCSSAPKVLRVDPSVRMGIVEIRSLRVSGSESGTTFARWLEGNSWHDITVAGTATSLQLSPNPIIEAYGEDPQLFLPDMPNIPDGEWIRIEIEVREMGYAQALVSSLGIQCGGPTKSRLGMLKYFAARLLAKLRGS